MNVILTVRRDIVLIDAGKQVAARRNRAPARSGRGTSLTEAPS